MRAVVVIVMALGLSLAAMKHLAQPWVWIFLVGATALGCAAAFVSNRRWRIVLANGAVILGAFALIEAGLMMAPGLFKGNPTASSRESGSVTNRYWRVDDIVGYSPLPNLKATSIRHHGDDLVFDVEYTTDAHGLRVPPPVQGGARPAILFFGGSFTYGEGVADHETLPYQVGLLSGGRLAVYNFGFHGYGPHQMLSAFEHGMVERIVTNPVATVIYQGLAAHVARSAGIAGWGNHGPEYRMNKSGQAVYVGHFDDPLSPFWERIAWQVGKSRIWQRLTDRTRPGARREERLLVAIVTKARDYVVKRWPGAEFHVVFWDASPAAERIIRLLGERGITIHRISTILPERDEQPDLYKIRMDGHPSARAYREMAEYVVDAIVSPSEEAQRSH